MVKTVSMANPFGKIFGANISSKGWIIFLGISAAVVYYFAIHRRR